MSSIWLSRANSDIARVAQGTSPCAIFPFEMSLIWPTLWGCWPSLLKSEADPEPHAE